MNKLANEKGGGPHDPLYDLGVLFVHGIGQPSRGDTLVRFGDPLCEWIRKWLDGAKPDQPNESQPNGPDKAPFKLREAFIQQRGDDPEAPPQVELHLRRTSSTKTVENAWLVAESWWPKSFITPRYRDLVWWVLLVSPWISARHCGSQVQRWAIQSLQMINSSAAVATGAVANCLIVVVANLLNIVSKLGVWIHRDLAARRMCRDIASIKRLRSALLTIQQRLVGTVGDSYVLLTSPIQETAIALCVISAG